MPNEHFTSPAAMRLLRNGEAVLAREAKREEYLTRRRNRDKIGLSRGARPGLGKGSEMRVSELVLPEGVAERLSVEGDFVREGQVLFRVWQDGENVERTVDVKSPFDGMFVRVEPALWGVECQQEHRGDCGNCGFAPEQDFGERA